MLRKDFLDTLKLVAPALSDHEIIPVLTHFWFTGESVMAYNDRIAMQTSLVTPFEGAVPGKLLIKLLQTSLFKELSFSADDSSLSIKSLNSKSKAVLRTTMLPISLVEEVFSMPGVDRRKAIKAKTLLPSIKACLRTVSTKATVPDQLGITVIPGDKSISLYSYNGPMMTTAEVVLDGAVPFQHRVILNEPFCKQLLEIGDDDLHFEIGDDYALAQSKDITLFGRLIDTDKPLDYQRVVSKHLYNGYSKHLIDIPPKVRAMTEQALVVGAEQQNRDNMTTQITVADGRLTFLSEANASTVKDSTPMPDHEDIRVSYNPRWLKEGCQHYDRWLIGADCLIMATGKIRLLIAPRGGSKH